jgi:hypothetical protein
MGLVSSETPLETLQSWLATAVSVIGVVINGVFIATTVQRLFR